MKILYLDTSKPECTIALYNSIDKIDSLTYLAHRELSTTILGKIEEILAKHQTKINDLEGLIAYIGPGSFTGLRIGISIANALSYSLNIPIESIKNDQKINEAITNLLKEKPTKLLTPFYGAEPHITAPKK